MDSSLYGNISFLLFLLVSRSVIVMAFDGKMLSRICSGELFTQGSNYESAMKDTLNDLITHTPGITPHDYYCQDARHAEIWYERDVVLYGHGVCTDSLLPQDCQSCLDNAKSEMLSDCTHSQGAQIQLMDCRLRYENYKFRNDG